ncbi:MAG: nuclear transport factor 2 family protein [Cytophagaceae bacterium]
MRTAKEVLDNHLELAKSGSVEEDLKTNYSDEVIILSTYGLYKGRKGAQELAEILNEELPEAIFEYKNVLIEGEVGFLEWTASSKTSEVKDGADSYVIRNGRIIAQTIHYTVKKK